jgi:hypothetical protein
MKPDIPLILNMSLRLHATSSSHFFLRTKSISSANCIFIRDCDGGYCQPTASSSEIATAATASGTNFRPVSGTGLWNLTLKPFFGSEKSARPECSHFPAVFLANLRLFVATRRRSKSLVRKLLHHPNNKHLIDIQNRVKRTCTSTVTHQLAEARTREYLHQNAISA